jgi:hypothetical protein
MSIINRYADVILAPVIAPRGLYIPGIADIGDWSLERKRECLAKCPMKKDPHIRGCPPVLKITKEGFKAQMARCVEMKFNGDSVKSGKRCRQWVKELWIFPRRACPNIWRSTAN